MSLSLRNWSLSLLCLVTAMLVGSSTAEAQTTVNAGAFQVEFWNQADGNAFLGFTTVNQADLGTWSMAEQQAVIRAFEYWTDVLNLGAIQPNAPILRFAKDESATGGNAAAASQQTTSATPGFGGTVHTKTNTYSRLLEGTNPTRNDGVDGWSVYLPGMTGGVLNTYNTDRVTQYMPGDFALERSAIHEIGHLLGGTSSTSIWNLLNNTTLNPDVFQGPNSLAVFGGNGVPTFSSHGLIDYTNFTRATPFGMSFRNIPFMSPGELAIFADMGYNITLSDHFASAFYQNGTGALQNNAAVFNSTKDYGVGVWLQSSNHNINQTGDLTSAGFAGAGLRIADGMNNIFTLDTMADINANGDEGIGVVASAGANNVLVIRGNVNANGNNGVGFRFDFGPPLTFSSTSQVTSSNYGAPLISRLDITGDISATTNAIQISDTAGIGSINIMQGASINGDILSNARIDVGNNLTRPTMTFGFASDANGQVTMMPDATFNFTFDDNIGGATLFDAIFAGGTSNLNGTSSFNSTDVMMGATLATTGTLNTGALDLMNGGTLISNGTVNATSIMMGQNSRLQGSGMINSGTPITVPGTIAPGNSIGTMIFNTSITGTPTTVLEIEAQPAVVPVPGTDNDLIVVNGGSYTFNGGFVNVLGLPPAGAYTIGAQYTYLQTTGGVNVAAAPTVADNLTNFRAIPFFTMNTAGFMLANDMPLVGIAQTYNQRNFGTYFDSVKLDTTNASAQVIRNNLDLLATPAQVRQAMDQLTGEIYGTMAISQIQNLSNLFTMVSDQVHHNHAPGVTCFDEIWYSGYGTSGQGQYDRNANETDFSSTGHLIGKSWCLGDETVMGMFYNYENDRVASSTVASTVESDSNRLGFYLRNQAGNFHTLVSGFGGWNSLDSSRFVNVNALAEANQGSYSGWNTGLYLENGLTYDVEFLEVQPYAALQLLQYQSDDFIETGGPNTTLGVNDIHINSFRTILGTRYNLISSFTGFRVGLDAAWVHENADDAGQYEAGLTSTPGAGFIAKGLDLGNDWFNIGPTMGWNFGPVSMFLDYQAAIGEQGTIHSGNGGAEILW